MASTNETIIHLRYSTLYMDTPQKTIYVDIPLSPIIAEVAMKTPIIDPLPSATLLLIIRILCSPHPYCWTRNGLMVQLLGACRLQSNNSRRRFSCTDSPNVMVTFFDEQWNGNWTKNIAPRPKVLPQLSDQMLINLPQQCHYLFRQTMLS